MVKTVKFPQVDCIVVLPSSLAPWSSMDCLQLSDRPHPDPINDANMARNSSHEHPPRDTQNNYRRYKVRLSDNHHSEGGVSGLEKSDERCPWHRRRKKTGDIQRKPSPCLAESQARCKRSLCSDWTTLRRGTSRSRYPA